MKLQIIIISLMSLVVFSGCAGPRQTVSISPRQSDKLLGECRLDHYSCDNSDLFAPAMALVKQLIYEYNYANHSPESAAVGIGCKISLTQKTSNVAENTVAWFVELQLEFYNLSSDATLRKTILNGQTIEYKDIIILIEDMLRSYFMKFTVGPALEIPVANGRTKFDTEGRKLLSSGKYQEALELFIDATDAIPEDHASWYNLGLTYELLGKYDQAILLYAKAYKIKPEELYQEGISRIGFSNLK